jgi:hypothetical protein
VSLQSANDLRVLCGLTPLDLSCNLKNLRCDGFDACATAMTATDFAVDTGAAMSCCVDYTIDRLVQISNEGNDRMLTALCA